MVHDHFLVERTNDCIIDSVCEFDDFFFFLEVCGLTLLRMGFQIGVGS